MVHCKDWPPLQVSAFIVLSTESEKRKKQREENSIKNSNDNCREGSESMILWSWWELRYNPAVNPAQEKSLMEKILPHYLETFHWVKWCVWLR